MCVCVCVCVRAGLNVATRAGIHERVHFMQSAEICVLNVCIRLDSGTECTLVLCAAVNSLSCSPKDAAFR